LLAIALRNIGRQQAGSYAQTGGTTARIPGHSHQQAPDMIELNPVRQRIADLKGRLDSLRGYL